MQSDITFNRHKKTVEYLNVAELFADTEKVIINLTKLIKQKTMDKQPFVINDFVIYTFCIQVSQLI